MKLGMVKMDGSADSAEWTTWVTWTFELQLGSLSCLPFSPNHLLLRIPLTLFTVVLLGIWTPGTEIDRGVWGLVRQVAFMEWSENFLFQIAFDTATPWDPGGFAQSKHGSHCSVWRADGPIEADGGDGVMGWGLGSFLQDFSISRHDSHDLMLFPLQWCWSQLLTFFGSRTSEDTECDCDRGVRWHVPSGSRWKRRPWRKRSTEPLLLGTFCHRFVNFFVTHVEGQKFHCRAI